MRKGKDITGQKFNSLTAIRKDEKTNKWLFKCDCGNEIWLQQSKVTGHAQTSCGCKKEKSKFIDRTGKRYGRLVCLSYDKEKKKWLCLCDCGKTCYRGTNEICANVKSCGCMKKEIYHGEVNKKPYYHRIYNSYRAMRNRCYNENIESYKWYGAKGIKICDEWQTIENFYNWSMENGYKEGYQIDRIDVNKDYCPENCRWISAYENNSIAHVNELTKKLEDKSTDDIVKEYIERKIKKMEKEKDKPKNKSFFYRRPTYSQLMSKDGTKKFLFKRQSDVCFFLNISYGSLRYRIVRKNGIINNEWKYEKIDKEIFEIYKNAGIEVVS